jgi:Spy/CpxP family protein refolding chaperone
MKNITLLFLLTIFAFGAFAQEETPNATPPPMEMAGPKGPPPAGDDRVRILRELNLSQEQIKTIRTQLAELSPRARQATQDFRRAQRALDEAVYADDVSDAQIDELVRKFQDAHLKMTQSRIAVERAIRNSLTSEQLAKFRELQSKAARRLQRLGQPGEGPGIGPGMRPGGNRPFGRPTGPPPIDGSQPGNTPRAPAQPTQRPTRPN